MTARNLTRSHGLPGPRVPTATPAAQDGAPHTLAPQQYDAILLVGFGGPEGQDEVMPFLRNVTRGRGIPERRLEHVAEHYRHFGGVSPINAQNRALQSALESRLAQRGIDLPVLWGNRNWSPYLSDALGLARRAGHRRLLAIATSAYSCYSSCRQYREDLAAALEESGAGGDLQIDKVRQYFDHPGFVEPFVHGLSDAIRDTAAHVPGLDVRRELEILFTTHSIPCADAENSGPAEREFGAGGAYQAQHQAVARAIMGQVGNPCPWQLVYQSRSGSPSSPWLGPDVNDAIRALPTQGRRAVAIVPLGFVSDHMEVLWDLDAEALQTAADAGLYAVRTPTPGVDPAFVDGLVDLVLERVNGTPTENRNALTELGPWYDVCRPGCCRKAHADAKPALAGIAP